MGRETYIEGTVEVFDEISIHSLRGEGDLSISSAIASTCAISIHSLRGEGDFNMILQLDKPKKFQSTPSVGRET